jgi:hypothetical protein
MGILYQNASGMMNKVVTRNQQLPHAPGNQAGEGIFVESGSGKTQITVQNSAVHDFQKNGIATNGAGISVQIENNSVRGSGPNPSIAEIQENTLGNTQGGIATLSIPGSDADKTNISGNWIFGTVSTTDGIDVCSNRNQVLGNTLHNSTEAGVHLDSGCGATGNNNTVDGNTVNEACAGVLEATGETGNSLSQNRFFNVSNTVLVSNSNSCSPAVDSPMIQAPGTTTASGSPLEGARFQPKP